MMYLNTSTGLPWLNSPVMLHSSRMDMCKLTPEQCAYRSGHWRYWYQADHVYGLNTIYFLCAVSGLFALAHLWNRSTATAGTLARASNNPAVAGLRYLSYRSFYIRAFSWYSPVLGVIILGLAGFVYFMAMTLGPQPYYWPNTATVSYGSSPPIATRTGFMALGLFPFVVLLSTKANWVTLVTGISHEKLQVFHRWTSWTMFVLALVHTFPFIIVHIGKGDMVLQWKTSVVYWTGVAALIPQAYLNIMSIGPIRNYCYEFFKVTHYIAVILFCFFFWIHCDFRLSSWDYFIASAALYLCSLLLSTGRYIFHIGIHHAHLELENSKSNNSLVRVTILTAMRWKPGQHIFIRFLTAGMHAITIHPFSICSLPDKTGRASDMVFYIKPKSGFTARLAGMAASGSANAIPVLLDGPYGGPPDFSLTGYEQVLLIAGGSGAWFLLPILEDLIRCTCHMDELLRIKVHLILAVRKLEEAQWFKSAVGALVHGDVCTCNIHISVYITGDATISVPADNKAIGEMESTLTLEAKTKRDSNPAGQKITDSEEVCGCDEMLYTTVPEKSEGCTNSPKDDTLDKSRIITLCSDSGRPNLPEIISTAVASHRSVGIVSCGPKSMLFDVRNSAATAQFREGKGKDVYLHAESFSW